MLDFLNPHLGNFSISQALGPANADYYYGDTTIEFRSKIKGVLAQWGSLLVPYGYDNTTAKNFFDQRIPVICFHGLQDPVVDPNIKAVNFAPVDNTFGYGNTNNVENSCLITSSFKTNGTLTVPDAYMYGSLSYFKYILQPLGIRREEYVDCDAKHGLVPNGSSFKSDYGIGDAYDHSTVDSVNLYIVGRGATFFQNIIGNSTPTTHKIFYECRNNRITCTQGNNDAGCQNNDDCGTHPHQ